MNGLLINQLITIKLLKMYEILSKGWLAVKASFIFHWSVALQELLTFSLVYIFQLIYIFLVHWFSFSIIQTETVKCLPAHNSFCLADWWDVFGMIQIIYCEIPVWLTDWWDVFTLCKVYCLPVFGSLGNKKKKWDIGICCILPCVWPSKLCVRTLPFISSSLWHLGLSQVWKSITLTYILRSARSYSGLFLQYHPHITSAHLQCGTFGVRWDWLRQVRMLLTLTYCSSYFTKSARS